MVNLFDEFQQADNGMVRVKHTEMKNVGETVLSTIFHSKLCFCVCSRVGLAERAMWHHCQVKYFTMLHIAVRCAWFGFACIWSCPYGYFPD